MNFAKHWAATLDDYAIDLAWSPDGTRLAAASAAGGITLFDAATGAVQHTLTGHTDGTNCLAWQPGLPPVAGVADPGPTPPSLLCSGGQDGCVRFWDPGTGRPAGAVPLGSAWVEHLAWQPGAANPLLFAAAGRKLVALRADGSLAHTFPDASRTLSALAWRADGTACAVACFGHVVVWDARTFAVQKDFSYGNALHALVWSPDGRWLVAGCHDSAVHLWAPAEDLELHMSGYENRLKELSFSHDSRWLATGGGRDACVWDCSGPGPEGREPQLLPHGQRITAVAYQHAHSLLATGDASGVFSLWSPLRKNPLFAEVTMPAAAARFAWSADDRRLAVGTEQGHVFVFRTD